MKKSIHPNEISPSFCLLPWLHLSTRPNGHLRLCCTANASSAGATNDKLFGGEVGILKNAEGVPMNLGHLTMSEAWNGPFMQAVRKKMLAGEVPPSCSKCIKEEKAGHRSKRVWETEYWSQRVDTHELIRSTDLEGKIPSHVQYLDLRLGSKCNLKCMMCSPHDSSLWVNDWHKLYPEIENPVLKENMAWPHQGKVDGADYEWHMKNPRFWEDLNLHLPHLKQLYFAGGEPLIIEDHYRILEEAVRQGEASHIELRYNSNGTVIPDRVLELWKHFKRVRFHFSLDSIEDMNHYIRYPSKFSVLERNLEKLDQTGPHVEVTLACAVQIMNIYYLPELIQWKLSKQFKKINPFPLGAGLVNFHFVYHPAHLNVKVLPLAFKEKVRDKIHNFCDWLEKNHRSDKEFLDNQYGISRLKGLVRFMFSEDWSNRMPEFVEYIRLLDKVRGTSFEKTFPEMSELLTAPATANRSELNL